MKINTYLGARFFWKGLTFEGKWHFILLLLVLSPFFLPLTRAVLIRIGLRDITAFSDYIFWSIALLVCAKRCISSIRWSDIFLIGGFVSFFYVSPTLYPQSAPYCMEHGDYLIFSCVPLYFIGLIIKINQDSNKMVWISRITILINYIYLFTSSMITSYEGSSDDEYNMVMSYRALLPALIIIWNTIEKRILWDYILMVLSVFLILSLGTRGPLICLITFIIGYLLFFRNYKYNIIVKTALVSLFIFLYSFINSIAIYLKGISLMLGVSTRIYDSILGNSLANFEESNGRDMLYEIMINKILNDSNGLGYGFFADRQFTPAGEYCHNFELEILVSFGKYGGGLILLLLLLLIYKSFNRTIGTPECGLLFAFFCATIMQLQFSGSYTTVPWFWLYLGLCVQVLRSIKTQKTIL